MRPINAGSFPAPKCWSGQFALTLDLHVQYDRDFSSLLLPEMFQSDVARIEEHGFQRPAHKEAGDLLAGAGIVAHATLVVRPCCNELRHAEKSYAAQRHESVDAYRPNAICALPELVLRGPMDPKRDRDSAAIHTGPYLTSHPRVIFPPKAK